MAKKLSEAEAKRQEEERRKQKQHEEGARALNEAEMRDATKSDEEKAAEEELAERQREEARQAELERAEAEQRAADEELAKTGETNAPEEIGATMPVPTDARVLTEGTGLLLNGFPVEVVGNAVVRGGSFANEQQYAAVLSNDPKNFALNAPRLRLVYSPMNGSLAPLDEQRLKLEEMTEAEAALFAPPARRAGK